MKTHCPNCEYGRVEMEVRRTRGGDFITAWDECPVCHGSSEIDAPRNTIEEIQITDMGASRWKILFTRTNGATERTGSWASAYRLERLLADLVNEGQYEIVYAGLTNGTITFYSAQLPY